MSDAKKRARRWAVALRIGVIVGGLGAYGLLSVRPKLLALSELDQRIAARETQATKRRADFARVQKFRETEEKAVAEREKTLREAIPQEDASGVSDVLDAAAKAASLSMIECRVLEPSLHLDTAQGGSGDKHFRVPVEATLRGRYRALPEFLKRIGEGPRAFRVVGLEVERDDAILPDVRIRLHLRAFFVEPPAAEAAGGGPR